MSDKDKRKNLPLPSILSSIRNVGRSSIFQQQEQTRLHVSQRNEFKPLMTEAASPLDSKASVGSSPSKRRLPSHVSRFFEKVQSMPMFERNKNRFQRRERGRRRGFQVDLPPKFILYTIFVFIVLPLILGSFFLMRQVFFESLKEDESHPLHKKQPRLRSHSENITLDNQHEGRDHGSNSTKTESHQKLGNADSMGVPELEDSLHDVLIEGSNDGHFEDETILKINSTDAEISTANIEGSSNENEIGKENITHDNATVFLATDSTELDHVVESDFN